MNGDFKTFLDEFVEDEINMASIFEFYKKIFLVTLQR